MNTMLIVTILETQPATIVYFHLHHFPHTRYIASQSLCSHKHPTCSPNRTCTLAIVTFIKILVRRAQWNILEFQVSSMFWVHSLA